MAGKDQDHVSTHQLVAKPTRMAGIGYSVSKTRAQLNRATRQEALREQIQAQGYHTHVLEVVKKLLDPELELDGADIARLKAGGDLSYKMMSKYIPDLKSQEITGPDGGDLVIAVQRKRFDGDD
jgi:hypothetical protein